MQEPRDIVYQTVDSLVGNLFPFVAATPEDRRGFRALLVEKVRNQRRLADAWAAVEEDRDALPIHDACQTSFKLFDFRFAAKENASLAW